MGAEDPSIRTVVGLYDSGEAPLTAEGLAAALGLSTAEAAEALRRLRACEFVTPEGDGYRPTVTAREFLELDDVDGPVIVDHARTDGDPGGAGTGGADGASGGDGG